MSCYRVGNLDLDAMSPSLCFVLAFRFSFLVVVSFVDVQACIAPVDG